MTDELLTTAKLDELGKQQVAKWQREHDRAIAKTSRASDWQRTYEIWGKVSLKFNRPLLHGPLTKENKANRRYERKEHYREHWNDSCRRLAQLENGWYRNWEDKFDRGDINPIPYSLIDLFLNYDKTDKREEYYVLRAVRYGEERLAARMLTSDVLFDMNCEPCKSVWPGEGIDVVLLGYVVSAVLMLY